MYARLCVVSVTLMASTSTALAAEPTAAPARAGLAACPRTYDTQEIMGAANAAEAHVNDSDWQAFPVSRSAMEERLTCSKDILSRSALAQVHWVEALSVFGEKRAHGLAQPLAAMFSAEPGRQLPAYLPQPHPLRDAVPAAMLAYADESRVPLPVPASGWIEVDGTPATAVPTARSAILQQIDSQGQVVATHYRWPDEVGFAWIMQVSASTAPPSVVSATPTGPPAPPRRSPWGRRAPLLAVTAASLAASAALYVVAAHNYAEFDAEPALGADATGPERVRYRQTLDDMRSQTNPLTYGYYVVGGAGLVLGAVAVITW